MQDITIEFIDIYGERMDLDLHHSLTLEITEKNKSNSSWLIGSAGSGNVFNRVPSGFDLLQVQYPVRR